MSAHLFLPGISLQAMRLTPPHQAYLEQWYSGITRDAENEDVASSGCLQGAFIDLVVRGRFTFDWVGVAEACLTGEDGEPLA